MWHSADISLSARLWSVCSPAALRVDVATFRSVSYNKCDALSDFPGQCAVRYAASISHKSGSNRSSFDYSSKASIMARLAEVYGPEIGK